MQFAYLPKKNRGTTPAGYTAHIRSLCSQDKRVRHYIFFFSYKERAVGAWHITRDIRLARLKSGLEKPECVAVRNRRFSTDFLSPFAADR